MFAISCSSSFSSSDPVEKYPKENRGSVEGLLLFSFNLEIF